MRMKRFALLTLSAILVTGCATSSRKPAPIFDQSAGATTQAVGTASSSAYYRVNKGETLFSIAKRHGQQVDDLVAWNNLNNPNDISVGQSLRVKPPQGVAASAPAAVQTAHIDSSGVETRPLDSAPAATPGTPPHLTTPQGEKVAYSQKRWEEMTTSSRPTLSTLPAPKPVPAPVDTTAARMVADTTIPARVSEGIAWSWPADGEILATFHGASKGVDISGTMGQKVVAAAAGKVIYSGAMRGYGNLVIIKHNDNLLSAYANNNRILVRQQASVKRGQKIAEMGKSDTDRVKLHFEVRRHGKPVDPARFLPRQR